MEKHLTMGLLLLVLAGSAFRFVSYRSIPPLPPMGPHDHSDIEQLVGGDFEKFRWDEVPRYAEYMHLKAGDRIADVGCGTGMDSIGFAGLVGPRGHVYAVDISAPVLEYLRRLLQARHVDNVTVVQSEPTDVNLPDDCVDLAFMSDVYHCFVDPQTENDPAYYDKAIKPFLVSLRRAVRPGGRLLMIDNLLHASGEKYTSGFNDKSVLRHFTTAGWIAITPHRIDAYKATHHYMIFQRSNWMIEDQSW